MSVDTGRTHKVRRVSGGGWGTGGKKVATHVLVVVVVHDPVRPCVSREGNDPSSAVRKRRPTQEREDTV